MYHVKGLGLGDAIGIRDPNTGNLTTASLTAYCQANYGNPDVGIQLDDINQYLVSTGQQPVDPSVCAGVGGGRPGVYAPNGPPPVSSQPILQTTVAPIPTVVQSSAPPSRSVSPSLAPSSGFDLSSIPWWGWALGAGAALFAFSK